MAIACGPASRNKIPILTTIGPFVEALRRPDHDSIRLLEIASGTGEHAAYFAAEIPRILVQPTEPDITMHSSISAWCTGLSVLHPLTLDVRSFEGDHILPPEFQGGDIDCIICINMIHISPWECTAALLRMSSVCLRCGGLLFTYGPYRVGGVMVESNEKFDESLKSRCSEWGIRDLEEVEKSAAAYGLVLKSTNEMPANNLCLMFEKK